VCFTFRWKKDRQGRVFQNLHAVFSALALASDQKPQFNRSCGLAFMLNALGEKKPSLLGFECTFLSDHPDSISERTAIKPFVLPNIPKIR
jgi:hypothetical protein